MQLVMPLTFDEGTLIFVGISPHEANNVCFSIIQILFLSSSRNSSPSHVFDRIAWRRREVRSSGKSLSNGCGILWTSTSHSRSWMIVASSAMIQGTLTEALQETCLERNLTM